MTTKRYTPDELLDAASFFPGNKTIAFMLKQAAEDCEDADRYRWLRDAPATKQSEPIRNWLWTRLYGADMACLDEAIDSARTQEQAK